MFLHFPRQTNRKKNKIKNRKNTHTHFLQSVSDSTGHITQIALKTFINVFVPFFFYSATQFNFIWVFWLLVQMNREKKNIAHDLHLLMTTACSAHITLKFYRLYGVKCGLWINQATAKKYKITTIKTKNKSEFMQINYYTRVHTIHSSEKYYLCKLTANAVSHSNDTMLGAHWKRSDKKTKCTAEILLSNIEFLHDSSMNSGPKFMTPRIYR